MNEELDLKEILKFTYQRKIILAIIVIIALILGMAYTFYIKKPVYEVTSQILINKADASIEQVVSSEELCQDKVKAEFDKTSKVIKITTQMQNEEEAFNTTNEYIEKLQTKLQEVYDIKTFQIIKNPELPQTACNMNYAKDILIALCVGIIIDGVYVMIALTFRGITDIYQVEENLKIKALGNVDLDKKKNENTYSTENEKIQKQLKRVQANIILNKDNKKPQIILLTGTKTGNGASFITNNLANEFSKVYSKILVIDTDIKNKTLTNVMADVKNKGLTDIIYENNQKDIEKLIQNTKTEKISVLPVGTAEIGEEVFLTETISKVIEELKNKFDVILIDSSSINENVFPIGLTAIADATVLIAEYGKSKQEDIIKAKTEIENVGGKITGLVLNKNI